MSISLDPDWGLKNSSFGLNPGFTRLRSLTLGFDMLRRRRKDHFNKLA